jgi:RNA polymerase sigma-70 factor (ECF subfamily)
LTQAQFKDLFDHHFDSVRNYIYYRSGDADTATDIAQETFIRVWEKQPDSNHDNIIGLLYKIAHDLFISHYRKEKVISKFRLASKPETSGRSPEDQVIFEELKSRYEFALAGLPEKQRIVFLMSRMEQLKYHEIAGRLGLTVKAVEKRMNLALVTLRKAIGD